MKITSDHRRVHAVPCQSLLSQSRSTTRCDIPPGHDLHHLPACWKKGHSSQLRVVGGHQYVDRGEEPDLIPEGDVLELCDRHARGGEGELELAEDVSDVDQASGGAADEYAYVQDAGAFPELVDIMPRKRCRTAGRWSLKSCAGVADCAPGTRPSCGQALQFRTMKRR